MSRKLVVSDSTNAKEVQRFLVAHNGTAKPIQRALVAISGKARQFWPAAGNVDPYIAWDTTPITVTNYTTLAGQPSIARMDFIDAGTYTYSDDPDDATDVTAGPFNWLLTTVVAIEQYIIKGVTVSGADTWAGCETLDTWLDAFGGLEFGVEQTTQGAEQLVLDIHVAKVDPDELPTLLPLAGTEVIKRVTFDAIVTDTSNKIEWPSAAATVVENKVGSDADVIMTFNPDGTYSILGDTSGSVSGNWHEDAPAPASPETFSVTVTKTAGDDTTSGPTLGAPPTLGTQRVWTRLSAITDGQKSGTFDVTVDDGVDSVTRSGTLTAERTEGTPDETGWTDTPGFIYSYNAPFDPTFEDAVATLSMADTGIGTGTFSPFGSLIDLPENWHTGAPTPGNPEDYEVYVTVVSGDAPTSGSALDTWIVLDTNPTWTLTADGTQVEFKEGFWDVTVGLRGDASTRVTKRVLVQSVSETGE
jgi:hypothetical protein